MRASVGNASALTCKFLEVRAARGEGTSAGADDPCGQEPARDSDVVRPERDARSGEGPTLSARTGAAARRGPLQTSCWNGAGTPRASMDEEERFLARLGGRRPTCLRLGARVSRAGSALPSMALLLADRGHGRQRSTLIVHIRLRQQDFVTDVNPFRG